MHRYSNLGPLRRMTFAGARPAGHSTDPDYRRSFNEAVEAARGFAEDPQGWLVLTGPSSSGKTHLAAAIANSCIESGHTVFFMSVPDLLDHLRTTYSPDSAVGYDDLFQQVKEVPVLILDDLGVQSSTPWAQEKLFQVFNHRFNTELPTVITLRGKLTNLDEGLLSRLQSSQLSRIYSLGSGEASSFHDFGGLEPEIRSRMRFDTFDVHGLNAGPRQQETLDAAFRAAQNISREPKGWLFLTGGTGCGKTHLAVSIVNERLERGEGVTFAFVPALLDHLRSSFAPDSRVAYDERFEQMKKSPLLILDDLGAESNTAWAKEKLYQIIVHRHNARLPTVITACTEDKYPFSDSITSRLNDATIVNNIEIEAPDYRYYDPKLQPERRGSRHK